MISSSRHFTPIAALLLCCVATVTSAQSTKVLVIGGRPQADVEKSFGLIANSQDPVDMRGNSGKLQAAVDAGSPVYPWFFPAHPQGHIGFFVGRTIVLPTDSGRKWSGTGLASSGASGPFNATGSKIIMRAQSGNISTTFDGDTRSGTTDGESDVLTVIGRDVHVSDLYGSFEITGGTNFVPGWYGIEAVDTENNTWTLDRTCTSGGSGSAMEGFYCPEVVQNRGYGTVHEGLHFTAKRLNADREGGVGYHVLPSQFPGRGIGSGGVGQSGKQTFRDCAFTGFDTALLLGVHMGHAYDERDLLWTGSGQSGGGNNGNHADHLTTHRTFFNSCRTCFHHRNNQSVCHNHTAVRALGPTTVFRFDSGGKMQCNGLEVSGSGAGGVTRILYLGQRVTSNHGPWVVRNFSFDGGGNTRNPQLVKTVNHNGIGVVKFDGGIMNAEPGQWGVPICDVTGGYKVILDSIITLTPGGDAGILGKRGSSGNGGYRPNFVVSNCTFGASAPSDPDPTFIIHDDCDDGITFHFTNNHNGPGSLRYYDGVFITDGNGGGTWLTGGPPSE